MTMTDDDTTEGSEGMWDEIYQIRSLARTHVLSGGWPDAIIKPALSFLDDHGTLEELLQRTGSYRIDATHQLAWDEEKQSFRIVEIPEPDPLDGYSRDELEFFSQEGTIEVV